MRLWTKLAIATGVTALALLGGCPFFNTSSGSGTVRLLISDKPYPFDWIAKAEITITKVEVHSASEPNDPNAADPNDPNQAGDPNEPNSPAGGFVTIFTGNQTFDLLNLRNGRADLLANAQISAGTYDQMRLVVTQGTVTLKDGRIFELQVPSGDESGIKLHFTFTVQGGQQTQLLLDVDLSRAFRPVPAGHITDPSTIREFQFQPSVAMRLIKIVEAGSIAGTVRDPNNIAIGTAAVTAYNGTTDVATTATEPDGTYVLTGLPTGSYRVEVSKEGYQDASVDSVSVTAGQTTSGVDVTLQP